jgi:hypothetical protein
LANRKENVEFHRLAVLPPSTGKLIPLT